MENEKNYEEELYEFGKAISENRLYNLRKYHEVFEELLKEYESQKKDIEYLQNRVDYYKHEYFAMCDLYEESQES